MDALFVSRSVLPARTLLESAFVPPKPLKNALFAPKFALYHLNNEDFPHGIQ